MLRNKKIVCMVLVLLALMLAGCMHTHEFETATCTEPATCSICGETEGEPLGHSVDIGICERCSEAQNYELVDNIQVEFSMLLDNEFHKAAYYIEETGADTLANAYLGCHLAQPYLETFIKGCEYLAEECGQYSELSNLKNIFTRISQESLPTISADDGDSLIEFLKVAENIGNLSTDAINEHMSILLLYI